MSGRLQNKVALITGTGSGQGRASAIYFAREGALVVGCDVNVETNEETVRLARETGGQMTGMAPVDLGDPDVARARVDDAARLHGRIDVLYNNAGAARGGAIDELSVEDWHFTTRNEIDTAFFVTRAAWPHLKKNGGVIISTASVAAHIGVAGVAHSTGKGAIHAMSRSFALEGAPFGIRAISISPGPIAVPKVAKRLEEDPEWAKQYATTTALNRFGESEEVAATAVFLASDESSYMTGCDVKIDGGKTLTRNQPKLRDSK